MKIKLYHLYKYNKERFLNTFIKVEQRVKILTYESFLEKYFKNNRYTYKEITEKQKVLKKVYFRYANKIARSNKDILIKKYDEALNNAMPKEIKEHATVFNINLTREDFLCYSNSSSIETLNIVRQLKYRNNIDIDPSALISLISKYYAGKEDFFIKLIASELSFTHEFSIFGKVWTQIAEMLNIKHYREIVSVLNGINRNRLYSRVVLPSNTIDTILFLVIDGIIWMDSSTSRTLESMLKFIDMNYEQKKNLIFAKANRCTGIVAGNVTFDSYNLPFKDILTLEDYHTLISEIIFIGDNSIKINLGNSNAT